MRSYRPAVLGLCFLLSCEAAGAASPFGVNGGARVRHAAPAGNAWSKRAARGRQFYTSSCGTTSGNGGAVFGGTSNTANARNGGVFVGNGNVVCDEESAIVGGTDNFVDSGEGADGVDATYSLVGAGFNNYIGSDGDSSMIGSGVNNSTTAESTFIGSGNANQTTGSYDAIGGGQENTTSGLNAFVGSGYNGRNTGDYGFIGTGYDTVVSGVLAGVATGDANVVTGNGSFIGGGGTLYGGQTDNNPSDPSDQISGADSFIGAGDENSVASSEAFVGSGGLNVIGSSSTYATILGGYRNNVTAEYASVLGGFGNKATAAYAIVAGGDTDTAAGIVSFAAGYHADAAHNGSFVWSDYSSGSTAVKDTAANQFVVRASGGTFVYSNEGATAGVELGAGSGSWASLSDRNAKTRLARLDDAAILTKVASLPVGSWSYASESGVRHIGPMAQDFYAAFGVGEDDRHITSIDEDGVALAAIKALHAENARMHSRLSALEARNAAMEARLEALEARAGH